MPNPGNVLGVA